VIRRQYFVWLPAILAIALFETIPLKAEVSYKVTDFGTLSDSTSSARSINDNGQIVGFASNSSNSERTYLFDPTGRGNNKDLNTLIDPSSGWTLNRAYYINDNGWIVGSGINPAGYNNAIRNGEYPNVGSQKKHV
jgi:probable HAF family extracellular repeat protein